MVIIAYYYRVSSASSVRVAYVLRTVPAGIIAPAPPPLSCCDNVLCGPSVESVVLNVAAVGSTAG